MESEMTASAKSRHTFSRRVLPVLLGLLLLLAVATGCARFLLQRRPLFEVRLNGKLLGYAESNRPVLDAVCSLENEMASASGKSFTLQKKLEFLPVSGKTADLTPDVEWLPLLYRQVGGEWTEAVILYLDGERIGAIRDETVAETVLDVITEQKNALLPVGSDETLELRNTVQFEKGTEQTDQLLSSEALYCLLTDKLSELSGSREQMLAASLLPVPAAEEEENTILLQFLSLRFETETVSEPCETEYVYSEEYYDGQEIVDAEGADGQRVDRYLLQSLDGTLLSRSYVDSSYTVEKQNRVIIRGTKAKIADGEFLWPIKGIITSYPGQRNLEGKDENHAGVDIDADEGEPFVAADCGTVTFAGYKQSWGNLTIIDHGNGYETYYAHQSEIFVKEGDVVYKGQTIGLCGQTGRAFGSHMHFEMHFEGHIINPLTVMPPMFQGDNYDRWR